MRYTYTTLTLLRGVSAPADGTDVVLLDGPDGVRAVLTHDVEGCWPLAHQFTAIANCVLNRMFGRIGIDMEFAGHVATELAKIRDERKRKHGASSAFLVVEFEGDADVVVEDEREFADFVVLHTNAPNNVSIRDHHEEALRTLKLGLTLSLDGVTGLDLIDATGAYWPTEAKPLYVLRLTGSAQGSVSHPIDPDNARPCRRFSGRSAIRR